MSDDSNSKKNAPHSSSTSRKDSPAQNGVGGCNSLIVALGASAGGLEAMSELLDNLPDDPGICIVVAQHRADGNDKDLLLELLAKHTLFELRKAEDGQELTAGVVHVIPPETVAHIADGRFELRKKQPREMVIDHLFTSLAHEAGRRAVAVVLSGSNTDGTQGAREIRAWDGLVLAQQPETATSDTMPRSIIQQGLADEILPPAQMPQRIMQYAQLQQGSDQQAPSEERLTYPPGQRKKLLNLLETRTGQDFSQYKANTVNRRIRRRMDVHHLENLENYMRLVQKDEQEAHKLFSELLISVTHFFRDAEAWGELKMQLVEHYLPRFQDDEFRAWMPGCATGEEAYTLAIILREALRETKLDVRATIYASDLDARSIDQARRGLYPQNIVQDVSEQRLERYFTSVENGYKVRREVRDMVVFATQNLLRDPPFSHLDMVCCRNLLMYLVPDAQRKVLARFQYGLKPHGLLFLGTAESVSTLEGPFKALEPKWRIFALDSDAKQAATPRSEMPMHSHKRTHHVSAPPLPKPPSQRGDKNLQRLSERFLLKNVCPPSVLATRSGEILYIHGRTGNYLELSPGNTNTNLFSMAREGLRYPLSDAMNAMLEQDAPHITRGIRVRTNDHHTLVDLYVRPMLEQDLDQPCYMISFAKVQEPDEAAQASAPTQESEAAERIRELEHELRHTRQNLRAVIEDYEATNEELESSNEELQSTNEELKSTNEELETSREELESINEEQSTLNDELQTKNRELGSINDDMANLMASTRVATLFLDAKLRIKRFTPAMQEVMGVREQDVGRPVQDISLRLDYDSLAEDAARVLENLDSFNSEVMGEEGNWYQLRISPYRTTENVIDGVVLILNDITELKRKERQARDAQLFAESIIDTLSQPMLVLDDSFTVLSANRAFCRYFQVAHSFVHDKSIFTIGEGQWDIPDLRRLLEKVIPEKKEVQNFEVPSEFPALGRKILSLNARQLDTEIGPPRILLLINEFRDIEENQNPEETA